MKIHILPKLITLSMLLLSGLLDAKQLIVHSSIPGRTPSDQFTCPVREVGTEEWKNAFVIQTTCKKNPDKKSRIKGPNNDNGYFDNLAGWSASYIATGEKTAMD